MPLSLTETATAADAADARVAIMQPYEDCHAIGDLSGVGPQPSHSMTEGFSEQLLGLQSQVLYGVWQTAPMQHHRTRLLPLNSEFNSSQPHSLRSTRIAET